MEEENLDFPVVEAEHVAPVLRRRSFFRRKKVSLVKSLKCVESECVGNDVQVFVMILCINEYRFNHVKKKSKKPYFLITELLW